MINIPLVILGIIMLVLGIGGFFAMGGKKTLEDAPCFLIVSIFVTFGAFFVISGLAGVVWVS